MIDRTRLLRGVVPDRHRFTHTDGLFSKFNKKKKATLPVGLIGWVLLGCMNASERQEGTQGEDKIGIKRSVRALGSRPRGGRISEMRSTDRSRASVDKDSLSLYSPDERFKGLKGTTAAAAL